MDVSVEVKVERQGKAKVYLLTLQAEVFELNVRIPENEAHEFSLVASSRWEDGSMQIGESAGAPVFWSTEEGVTAILIGDDDEHWDIALSVPVATVDAIIQAIAQA